MNFLVILIVVWLVALAGWLAVSRAFKQADADKIKDRLVGKPSIKKEKSAQQTAPLIQTEDPAKGTLVLRFLKKYELMEKLKELIEQSGLRIKPVPLIHMSLGLFLLGFVVAWTMLPPAYQTFALIPGFAVAAVPLLHVLRKRKARMRNFEEQFPESLEFVARSMRAGHAFSVSLEMIHREFQEPLAGEFKRTFEEHNLGLPLDVALLKLSKRVPSMDVHFFVSAVLLQKRTGGNLAEILDKLAYVIRERFKLRGRIRAISAHGRMTGMALTCIPVAVGVLMFYVNPGYVKFFVNDETGNIMAGAAVLLQLLGYGVIKKIVSIEV